MQQLSWVQNSFGGSNSSIDIASTLGGGRKAASIHECRNTNSAQECRNPSELGGSQRVSSASSLRGGERNGNGGGPSALNSIASTDEFERMINEQIEDLDTRPGNAAQKLHRLVQQPFRAQFGGSESRIPSSRDVEQQRAASSQRPRFTPILQGNDPEIILLDSPKDGHLHHNYQQHEQPPTPSPPSFTQQQQRPATDRQQPQPHQPVPTHSRAYQPRAPSPPSPSPLEQQNALRNEYQSQQQHQSRPYSQQAQFQFDRPAAPLRSRYQSVYDLNHRPHVPPAINVDSWALGPCHYRRLYLDSLVKRIRENEQRNSKLRSQLSRFDRSNQQELDELELLYREQELEARKMQHEERLREQEQLERQAQQQSRTTTGISTTSPPRINRPLVSILKKPPPKTAFAPLTPAPRVAFKSPPNRSDNNWPTSSSQMKHPPSFTDLQLERDRESRRLNYVAKWHQNHEMLRQAKRRNPRINLNSNPSAIFQMVPSI